MEKALTDICEYLNNYFWRKKHSGKFVITGGTLTVDYLQPGQYFRIVNSVFNDGIHKYPATDLTDEEFTGSIWSMAVPQTVIDIASDVSAWQAKYGSVNSLAMSPFNSESLGNYSYSKGSNGSDASGNSANSWQAAFASRLSPYRRMRGLP